jgi:hypothetical protein
VVILKPRIHAELRLHGPVEEFAELAAAALFKQQVKEVHRVVRLGAVVAEAQKRTLQKQEQEREKREREREGERGDGLFCRQTTAVA